MVYVFLVKIFFWWKHVCACVCPCSCRCADGRVNVDMTKQAWNHIYMFVPKHIAHTNTHTRTHFSSSHLYVYMFVWKYIRSPSIHSDLHLRLHPAPNRAGVFSQPEHERICDGSDVRRSSLFILAKFSDSFKGAAECGSIWFSLLSL